MEENRKEFSYIRDNTEDIYEKVQKELQELIEYEKKNNISDFNKQTSDEPKVLRKNI
jgi:hypothetical protein